MVVSELFIVAMRDKQYKMRGRSTANGKTTLIDVDLEFDGNRAFVVWDSLTLGSLHLKARVEIDPNLLQSVADRGCDFFYRGELILPSPQNN
jgi:hypothetical protein